MNNYDQYDQESQALLHGIKPLSFEEIMGGGSQNPFSDLAKNTSNASISRKNPLAYSPLSKSGTDIQNNFFQGSTTYRNNNLQITVDPSSNIDPYKKIIPIERGFYYDKNKNGIQDENEKYVVTIKLFITKEASQLKAIYYDPTIKPDPKEILFFLEDNDKDFSGTTLYIKRGNQVDAALSEMLADSKTFTSYIKSQYGISLSDLRELIKEGVVKNNIQNFIFSIVELASFVVSNPVIFNGIALAIKKAVDTLKETCTIEEKNWNPLKAGENFSPFLFPFAPALDALDDKAINDFIKSGIIELTAQAGVFDKKIENTLNLISQVKIPIIFPIIKFTHSVSVPETFTDLILMKYRQLRFTMDNIIANLNNIDFSTLIEEGINVINAFFCGIWNGFVEAVCGIISLVQYLFQGAESLTDLLKNFKEKGPALLEKIDDIILKFQQIDFGQIFTKLASNIKEWVLSSATISMVELAYFSGMFIGIVVELVIEIVVGVLFTGGTLSITAILAKLGETFKALGNLLISVVKAPFKLAGKTVSAFADGLNWLYEFLEKGTDEILRLLDEVFVNFKKGDNLMTEAIELEEVIVTGKRLQSIYKILPSARTGFKKLELEIVAKADDYLLKWKEITIFKGDYKDVNTFWSKILKPKTAIGTGGALKYLEVLSRNMFAQEHSMSCAAACIRQLAKDSGIEMSETIVRSLAGTTEKLGTYEKGMLSAAKKIFKEKEFAEGTIDHIPVETSELIGILGKRNPWVAWIKESAHGGNHAIIVDKVENGVVYIRDPWPIEGISKGSGVQATVEMKDFEIAWSRTGKYAFWFKN